MSDAPFPEVPRRAQTVTIPAAARGRFTGPDGAAVDSVGVRVRDAGDRILLVRNDWSEGWIVPGGAVEAGETHAVAARREVREETGLEVSVGAPLGVLEQTFVAEADGRVLFEAPFVLLDATVGAEAPPVAPLGLPGEGIAAARWFETPPAALHDGTLLRSWLDPSA